MKINPWKKPAFKYRRQFAVVVKCADEKAQRAAYNKLRRLRYDVKVVCT